MTDQTPLGIRFGRHVPKILRKQLIAQLIEQYLTNTDTETESTVCSPSFQRFHGALLFVDISGFTALSQKLSVEELKNCINDYFTKMLNIVDKHGGDVIKFAGDALYIIWPIDLPITSPEVDIPKPMMGIKKQPSNKNFMMVKQKSMMARDISKTKEYKELYKIAVEKAVKCGAEITVVCGNHKIMLDPNYNSPAAGGDAMHSLHSQGSSSLLSKLLPPMNTVLKTVAFNGASNEKSSSPKEEEPAPFALLNVHSGVAMGLMAGIDIGANDRWEYFLLGDPLSLVAEAESQAQTGDIIICPESHSALHPVTAATTVMRRNSLILQRQSSVMGKSKAAFSLLSTQDTHNEVDPMTAANTVLNSQNGTANRSGHSIKTNISINTGVDAGSNSPLSSPNSANPPAAIVYPCGCTPVSDGFFKVNTADFCSLTGTGNSCGAYTPHRNSKLVHKLTNTIHEGALLSTTGSSEKSSSRLLQQDDSGTERFDKRLLDEIRNSIDMSYRENKVLFKRALVQHLKTSPQMFKNEDVTDLTNEKMDAIATKIFDGKNLKSHYSTWVNFCLIDDMSRHVHEVARNNYHFKNLNRNNAFKSHLDIVLSLVEGEAAVAGFMARGSMKIGTMSRIVSRLASSSNEDGNEFSDHSGTFGSGKLSDPSMNRLLTAETESNTISKRLSASEDDVSDHSGASSGRISNFLQGKSRLKSVALHVKTHQKFAQISTQQKKQRRSLLEDSDGFIAEIRNVIVMFVKLEISNMELLQDMHGNRFPLHGEVPCNYFNFSTRTINEKQSDLLLLERLQACIEVLNNAFISKGGQLRQFIVDDKGTVCIGTFGLRGAVSDDNAAAAIETAKLIVVHLHNIGLRASIGITSGKTFCGLVGSTKRHEYAVMGPSTNLSARLMCKAPPCGVICDIMTRNRDRTHEFEKLADVVAKGYADPVGTFKPDYKDMIETDSVANPDQSIEAFTKVVKQLNLRSSFDAKSFMRTSMDFQGFNRFLGNFNRQGSSVGSSMANLLTPQMSSIGKQTSTVGAMFQSVSNLLGGSKQPSPSATGDKYSIQDNTTTGLNSTNNVSRVSSLENNNTESYHPIIRRIMKSQFYLKNDKKNVENNRNFGNKNIKPSLLHGRHEEIRIILEFLFIPLLLNTSPVNYTRQNTNMFSSNVEHNNSGGDLADKSGATNTAFSAKQSSKLNIVAPNNKVYFDTTLPTRMVSLYGPQGIGKDGIVQAVTQQLFIIYKQDPRCNLQIFKNTHSSFHLNVSFHGWKVIFREMMSKVFKFVIVPNGGSTPKVSNKKAKELGLSTGMYEVVTALDYLLNMLPVHMKQLKPLLGAISFIVPEPDNEHTANLKGQLKINKTCDLLCAIIQLYPMVTLQLSLFVLMDIQSFDIPSLQLMHQIWSRSTGFLFLTTCRNSSTNMGGLGSNAAQGTTSGQEEAEAAGSINTDNTTSQLWQYIQSIQDPERLLHLEIDYLNKDAVESLVRDALLQHNISEIDDATIDKLYQVSGGNPLYAYELTKAITEHTSDHIVVDIADLTKVISNFRSNRIEEVICHRFDQLNVAAQTVLKMASVACSNNSSVTFDLLSFILNDDAYEESGAPTPHHTTHSFFKSTALPITTIQEEAEESTTAGTNSAPPEPKLSDSSLSNAIYEILCSNEFIHAIEDDFYSENNSNNNPFGNSYSALESGEFISRNSASNSSTHNRDNSIVSVSSTHNFATNSNNNNDIDTSTGNNSNNVMDNSLTSVVIGMENNNSIINSTENSQMSRNGSLVLDANITHGNNTNMTTINHAHTTDSVKSVASTVTNTTNNSVHNHLNSNNNTNNNHSSVRKNSTETSVRSINSLNLNRNSNSIHENRKMSEISNMSSDVVQKELITSNIYKYEFKIMLEQHIIYDLLLDDQKHQIHEKTAVFYRKLNSDIPSKECSEEVVLTYAAQYYEEGFHWQHTSEWHTAINCYYCAANLLKPYIQYNEIRKQYLAAAYTLCKLTYHYTYHTSEDYFENRTSHDELLLLLKSASGNHNNNATESSVRSVRSPNSTHGSRANNDNSNSNSNNTSSINTITLDVPNNNTPSEQAINTIETDIEMLFAVLQIHLQLAQLCVVLVEDSTLIAQIYTDIIHIFYMNSAERLENLLLRPEFKVSFYAILAGYIDLHAVSESHKQTSLLVAKKYLMMSAMDPSSPIHHIQCLVALIPLYCDIGKRQEANNLCEELTSKYRIELHSSDLVSVYGRDAVQNAVDYMRDKQKADKSEKV